MPERDNDRQLMTDGNRTGWLKNAAVLCCALLELCVNLQVRSVNAGLCRRHCRGEVSTVNNNAHCRMSDKYLLMKMKHFLIGVKAVMSVALLSLASLAQAAAPADGGKQTFTANGVSFTMVAVRGGTFTMGATSEQESDAYWDEKPAHKVTLSSFCIGETEVTQELWQAVMGTNPSAFKGTKHPVENVSWFDCQEFLKKLNVLTGKNFRLPSEAEWEYAARGGSRSRGCKYSGSNNIDDVAWYDKNCYDKGEDSPDYGPHDVGGKKPNELGLYDMSGNVREWCNDWWEETYYSASPQSDPRGPEAGADRLLRGGSWFILARCCRVAYRSHFYPDYYNYFIGLRLAL